MNSTAVQFINFGAAAVQVDLFCAPCQGALFSPVKDRAGGDYATFNSNQTPDGTARFLSDSL
jgi:hypothetical protein